MPTEGAVVVMPETIMHVIIKYSILLRIESSLVVSRMDGLGTLYTNIGYNNNISSLFRLVASPKYSPGVVVTAEGVVMAVSENVTNDAYCCDMSQKLYSPEMLLSLHFQYAGLTKMRVINMIKHLNAHRFAVIIGNISNIS